MLRTLVRSAVRSGGVAVLMTAQAVAASPAGSPDRPPEKQLVVSQSGVRFRLGPFALGRDWIAVTVIVENRRDGDVHLAAVSSPGASDALQAKFADDKGEACTASAEPAGIATMPPPGPTAAASIDAMTTLPPHTRANIALRFAKCHLSRTSPLSFSGEFALMTREQPIQLIDVKFTGIEQRTTTW